MSGGSISDEIEVKVGAGEAWKVYGSLQLANFALQSLPHMIGKIDILQGDGAAGTVLKLTFASPSPSPAEKESGGPAEDAAPAYHIEKFTAVDHQKRVKVAEVIEGGHLELGFTLYRVRFEVIEKGEDSCITKVTIEYEAKEPNASSLVTTQPFLLLMQSVADYLTKDNNIVNNNN